MHWEAVEQFIQKGQAILPVNKPGVGDVTRLVDLVGRERDLAMQATTFLKHVLAFFGADLVTLRRRFGPLIGKKKMVPLPLSSTRILIPFNTREAIGRQTRTGWVVACRVMGVEERSEVRTAIQLINYTVEVHHSHAFCMQQLRYARLVQLEFDALHKRLAESQVSESSSPYSE